MNKAKTIQQKQLIELLQEPNDVQVVLFQDATMAVTLFCHLAPSLHIM